MRFDLPSGTIVPVHAVRVALDPAPHPFEASNARAIAENWRGAVAQNPALFDGQVALLSSLAYRDGALSGRCHIVRYACFLYWRRMRPVGGAGHIFTHPMPVSADNALIAIRMGAQTANAGKSYFAAGSFEPVDFRDGFADVEFNSRREVLEETGLDLAGRRADPHYHAVSLDSGTVLFRRYFFAEDAETLAGRIASHVAAQDAPEIEGPVIIRDPRSMPKDVAPQMPALVGWHFCAGVAA